LKATAYYLIWGNENYSGTRYYVQLGARGTRNPAGSAQRPAPGYFPLWPLVRVPSPLPIAHGLTAHLHAALAGPGATPARGSLKRTDSFSRLHWILSFLRYLK